MSEPEIINSNLRINAWPVDMSFLLNDGCTSLSYVSKLQLLCQFDIGDRNFLLNVNLCSCLDTLPKFCLVSSQMRIYYEIAMLYLVIIPPEQRSCWGVYWFHSVRLSVRLSVCPSVRLSRLPCPLCNIYSSGWILSILATNDHYHERVCRTQWPLTLTYIFKVIWPWLRKSCPFCSVYSSEWILFIFGTNDYYH